MNIDNTYDCTSASSFCLPQYSLYNNNERIKTDSVLFLMRQKKNINKGRDHLAIVRNSNLMGWVEFELEFDLIEEIGSDQGWVESGQFICLTFFNFYWIAINLISYRIGLRLGHVRLGLSPDRLDKLF
jgi:hypothetical protein